MKKEETGTASPELETGISVTIERPPERVFAALASGANRCPAACSRLKKHGGFMSIFSGCFDKLFESVFGQSTHGHLRLCAHRDKQDGRNTPDPEYRR